MGNSRYKPNEASAEAARPVQGEAGALAPPAVAW